MSFQGLIQQTRRCLLVFAGFFICFFNAGAFAQGEVSPHIQVLSASCAACHGTNGNSVGGTPVLAGLDRAHFIAQMMAFRTGERSSTVMHRHAKGLTQEEISDLADFFAMQPRETMHMPSVSHAKEP
jgi:cytochrome c553